MKEVKLGSYAWVSLLLLLAGLVACSAVFGSPLTDDVATLDILKENIPRDYRIRVRYISKAVGGQCWLHLNLFPLESSLKNLALKFGNLSTNRENITMFITMLKGLRFTIDNEELEVTMQMFKCHYRIARWSTRRYFDHVKEVLQVFSSTPHQFHCTPPPCETSTAQSATQDKLVKDVTIPSLLSLLIIPCVAVLAFCIRRRVHRRRKRCAGQRHDPECNLHNTDTQQDPEACRLGSHSEPESCSLHQQYRVQQNTSEVEDTAV